MRPDGSQLQTFARGVRNTVGFDWHPTSGELWFTDNGRDLMGDDLPPDELNHAPKPDRHFGYPYCHGGTIADPEYGRKRAVRYETFASGWLQGDSAWGRPADVLVLLDGSLLVLDDHAGAVYRIRYMGQ